MKKTALPKRFKYKTEREVRITGKAPQIKAVNKDEVLTGIIKGFDGASDLEERFSRALDKNSRVYGYTYREHFIGPTRSSQGSIEVDFMVKSRGETFPVQIDGEFAHKTQSKRDQDAQKDQVLNNFLKRYGIQKVQRVPDATRMNYGLLDNQENADALVDRMF